MKVFIFYGNRVEEGSASSLFLEMLVEQLKNNQEIEDIVLRSSNNTKLGFMNTWKDVLSLDEDAERRQIKEEILAADVFIFLSPVYLHNVSGFAKVFLDNFASWSHTMPLIGKVGVPISLSSSNGNVFVNDYLYKILSYWGLSTVKPMSVELSSVQREALPSYVRFIVRNILEAGSSPEALTNKMQEDAYKVNREAILSYPENHPERIEFEQYGNVASESFREALADKLNQITESRLQPVS